MLYVLLLEARAAARQLRSWRRGARASKAISRKPRRRRPRAKRRSPLRKIARRSAGERPGDRREDAPGTRRAIGSAPQGTGSGLAAKLADAEKKIEATKAAAMKNVRGIADRRRRRDRRAAHRASARQARASSARSIRPSTEGYPAAILLRGGILGRRRLLDLSRAVVAARRASFDPRGPRRARRAR